MIPLAQDVLDRQIVDTDDAKVELVGVGALLGTGRSRRKARASQRNGQLGGRPRTTALGKNAR